MSQTDVAITRIMVALDTSAHSSAALDTAAELASALGAHLLGLFVEDINLLRLAGLPFAREVGRASAAARPLEFAEVERRMRMEAARAQRSIAGAAQRLQLQWSFRVTRGQMIAQVLAEAGQVDMVVFGRAGEYAAPVVGPVLVLFDGSPAALQALATAARLAQANERQLGVLIPAGTTQSFQQQRGLAAASLGHGVPRASYVALASSDVAHLARAARAEKCSAFVLASGSPPLGADEMRALLHAIGCPVVLLK
jgi:nucleotide-binding universal stress UspA family protein